jgi:CheY-like chemotaxis protein/anti-sigma regulatory factor (Ser/Thr protein kinase)
MIKSRAEGKGLRFTLELDPELPCYLQGDAGKLRQILINLLGNAVKFTEAGEVWLRAHSQPVADDPAVVMLQLEVEDSGPGIPPDKLAEVFETFVQLDQTAEKGTGLGLAISKSLADMMGGQITVDSEVGRGTLFRVNLPLPWHEAGMVTPDEAPAATVSGLQAGQPDWRILVVDDNRENRLLLTSLLTWAGFTVQEAENGEAAIVMFQEWRPHFIWMDMRMPVLDGYTATQKIRAQPGGEAVKIVAVTASALVEHREEILAAGCDDVVRKPFQEHQIFEAMARHLGVNYRYKEGEAAPAQRQGEDLTPAMLAELPPELLQELRETTLALNTEATLEVIERIADQAPEGATGLRELVQNFQMGRLRELLAETEQYNDD